MINPSIDVLLQKVDSKYTLVGFAAKRARGILNGESTLVESPSNKPVTIALEEIAQGKIIYERTAAGIK